MPTSRVERTLLYVLRHFSDFLRPAMDKAGFVSREDLWSEVSDRMTKDEFSSALSSLAESGRVEAAAARVKALYGHSVEIAHTLATPPSVLLHGTCATLLPVLRRDGLLPQSRSYVHLTSESLYADRVSLRRAEPMVLEIDAARASQHGIVFYQASCRVWLAKAIPARFLRERRAPVMTPSEQRESVRLLMRHLDGAPWKLPTEIYPRS
jgi:putative RNA 2'-phosphotransferase